MTFLRCRVYKNLTDEFLHYSQSVAAHRPNPSRHLVQFSEFKKTVDMSAIQKTVRRVMKQLMFTYKCQFERILKADGR